MKWPVFALSLVAFSTAAACLAASYGKNTDAAALDAIRICTSTEADARRALGEPEESGVKGALRFLAYDRGERVTLAIDGKHTVVGIARGSSDGLANQCGRKVATAGR